MRLSTKGRYAVTAMLDLAIHHAEGPVTLAEISESQGISLSYLEQLFARLRKHELVVGLRGPGGGYRLSRRPQDISVAEVITAIGEGIDATQCEGKENCQEGERCLTHVLWTRLGNEIYEFLNGITLASFIERDNVNQVIRRQQQGLDVMAPGLNKTVA
ncbi:MAG: Rrf2 family transcriptional regulator [Gammaproteobacteria bacterium]|nr:Rrf2 family transcriptional regulator [Gammaproteobacteria bacterium]MDH3559677.1 Rrf2 family transcriptional regulator [Gammaproteobacteria bacterium]